jgi:hypothetical protein
VHDWLARHPRFHVHFTPTGSSWINQVERWFGYLTDQVTRRVHKACKPSKPTYAPGSTTGTATRNHSLGRPPRKSSTPSANINNEFQAQDTSGL